MKKNKACIIVDSSSGLKNLEIDNVYMIPLSIIETDANKKEIIYKDLEEISPTEILSKLDKKLDLKTSQASIGLKIDLLEKLVNSYEDIYVVPISAGISSSYETWLMLQKEFLLQNKNNIHIINSNSIYMGTRSIVKDMISLIEKNKTPKEIIEYVNSRRNKLYGVLIVQDPSQLKKGGRINSFKAMIVKALKINLLISFDGKLTFFAKEKSEDKAIEIAINRIDEMIDIKNNKIKNVFLFSTYLDENKNNDLIKKIESKINHKIEFGLLPPTISIHTGNNAFCIYVEVI